MAINQQFPQAPTSPLTAHDGRITVPWHQFLTSLWHRTGGPVGDASSVLDALGNPVPGVTIFRGPSVWQYLPIGTSGQLYTVSTSLSPRWEGLSALLDRVLGSTPGNMLYRGPSQWSVLGIGAQGTVLESVGVVPTWTTVPVTSGAVSAPTGTTSATEVMMGRGSNVGFFITPTRTGRIVATIAGCMANNAANGGVTITGRFGTGTPPANGDAFTGTQWSTTQHFFQQSARDVSGFTVIGGNPNLTLGTPVWFDVSISATGGGTATVTDVQGLLFEI
jgi:hypothetical protein